MIDYVSLHNHTSWSIMEALTKPSDLFERAKELGQTSIGVTDHGTMAGLWDSWKASKKTGVKLIAGCEFNFVNDVNNKEEPLRHLILLAKNAEGYRNLLLLGKKGFDNYIVAFKRSTPRIDWALLKEHSAGLICTTADGNGIIGQSIMNDKMDLAKEQALKLKEIFEDNLAFEFQAHALVRKATAYSGAVDQNKINFHLKKLAAELGIRGIITNDSHYLTKDQAKTHDVLLAMGSGQPIGSGQRLNFNVPEFYVKNAMEAAYNFVRLNSLYPELFITSLFENTVHFADLCEKPEWIDPKFSNPSGKELPEFDVASEPDYQEFAKWRDATGCKLAEDSAYLRFKCMKAISSFPEEKKKSVKERINEELDVFNHCGVSSYMLIVADYINWARRNGVACGPGRGSICGSYVGYLLGIHEADPIKYGLVFARFHNKLKDSYSDIDADFCTAKRHLVDEYIVSKYGADKVAHISNYNTITSKPYVKSIARTFEYGGSMKDAVKIGMDLADLIPDDMRKIDKAIEEVPLLNEYVTTLYKELKDYTKISGLASAVSTHAAGIVINKRELPGLVCLRRDKEGSLSLEYEKERTEECGLVKMDILGLTTLDVIEETYRQIELLGKPRPDFNYELEDEKTYDLISRGNTLCVFQFGTSGGTIDLCKKYRPKNIEDLAIITTLARPAAAEIRGEFFEAKNGIKPKELLHPAMERAFRETLGFALFDESLLILTNDLAGWDLHKADSLRKMTKDKGKYPEKVAKIKEDFIKDTIKFVNMSEELATTIWTDIIEVFGMYSFNKSHAVAYSMISFHTAFLKANYPVEFLVANLMNEIGANTPVAKDNIIKIKNEVRSLGVQIVAPDINTSSSAYKIIDEKTLMTGLDAMKYMGKDAMPEIIAQRPYNSFEDFLTRIDGKKVRMPAVQALAASGCLDSFGISRKRMFLYASDYKKKYQAWEKKKPEKRTPTFQYPWPKEDDKDWNPREKYALEKYYVGEGISGTVFERFDGFLDGGCVDFRLLPKKFPYKFLSDDERTNRKKNTYYIPNERAAIKSLKGVITSVFSFKVKREDSALKGQTMARMTVADPWNNELSVVIFPDTWKKVQETLHSLSAGKQKFEAGIAIQFIGAFQHENENTSSLILDDILKYKEAPILPPDLKAKKVKMPRGKAAEEADIEKVEKEEPTTVAALVEELENELIDDGLYEEDEDDYTF